MVFLQEDTALLGNIDDRLPHPLYQHPFHAHGGLGTQRNDGKHPQPGSYNHNIPVAIPCGIQIIPHLFRNHPFLILP